VGLERGEVKAAGLRAIPNVQNVNPAKAGYRYDQTHHYRLFHFQNMELASAHFYAFRLEAGGLMKDGKDSVA
jgi:hypothetical protein